MTRSLGLVDVEALDADALARTSRASLDFPVDRDAELTVARVTSEAIAIGAFARGDGFDAIQMLVRRGSGGPAIRMGPGTIYVRLRLARPDALVPCDVTRVLNRYVRPILRALTKLGANASYGGRDWIAVRHRPAAAITFAHDASSQRTAVEAFVAVRAPFAIEARASFLGKEPGTLESIAGRAFDDDAVRAAILDAFAREYDATFAKTAATFDEKDDDPRADPPWRAIVHEPIGEVAAGPDRAGVLRVGGDLIASRDAIARLEATLARGQHDDDDLAEAVDDAFGRPGVALEGARPKAIHDVLARALRSSF